MRGEDEASEKELRIALQKAPASERAAMRKELDKAQERLKNRGTTTVLTFNPDGTSAVTTRKATPEELAERH